MATTDLVKVFTTLFTAPAEASVQAEKEYRRIWRSWLSDLSGMLKAMGNEQGTAQAITKQLDLAPILKFESAIEVGVTLHVAEVSEMTAQLSAGLRFGVIESSGTFGFMNRQTLYAFPWVSEV